MGRVVQDVVTSPSRKWARMQGDKGYVEWHCAYRPGVDAVFTNTDATESEFFVKKTRPDDFILELNHIASCLSSETESSEISIDRGLDTMLVIAAAHKSVAEKCSVRIDYTQGYVENALLGQG